MEKLKLYIVGFDEDDTMKSKVYSLDYAIEDNN